MRGRRPGARGRQDRRALVDVLTLTRRNVRATQSPGNCPGAAGARLMNRLAAPAGFTAGPE